MRQLIKHVENSTSFNPYQSAYRKGYSTETALLKLLNDIYNAADCSKRSLLLLLDLSAAFDCIDINIQNDVSIIVLVVRRRPFTGLPPI